MAFKLPDVRGFTAPYGANTSNQYGQAAMGAAGQILGGIAPSMASGLTGLSQGLVGLGNSYANNYGSYAGALGSIAQAQANNESNQYGSRAMAEAARQGALGTMGAAALGAYGSAANSGMSAWAQNQMAYNKSLSEMQQANQQGLSNLGVSRNAALGNLASAYADAGGKLGAAGAVGDLNFSFGDGGAGGGFNATGTGGDIASGSFGSGGGLYGNLTRTSNNSMVPGISDRTFGGLQDTRTSLMAGDVMDALKRDADLGRDRLDAQHYSSRGMPSQMMDQALAGLLTMSREGYGESGRGMDQFYDSVAELDRADPRDQYGGILGMLADGYRTSGEQLGGLRGDLNSGYDKFRDSLGGIFNTDPVRDAQQAREVELLKRRYANEDKMAADARTADARARAAAEAKRLMDMGYTWNGATGGWLDRNGRPA